MVKRQKTVPELKAEAKRRGLSGYSSLTKPQLEKLLKKKQSKLKSGIQKIVVKKKRAVKKVTVKKKAPIKKKVAVKKKVAAKKKTASVKAPKASKPSPFFKLPAPRKSVPKPKEKPAASPTKPKVYAEEEGIPNVANLCVANLCRPIHRIRFQDLANLQPGNRVTLFINNSGDPHTVDFSEGWSRMGLKFNRVIRDEVHRRIAGAYEIDGSESLEEYVYDYHGWAATGSADPLYWSLTDAAKSRD